MFRLAPFTPHSIGSRRKGLVKSWVGEPTDARGGRAKKCFTITGAGAEALERSQQALRQMLAGLPARWNPSR